MDKIENLANKYVERHIRDRHLSDDTIKEIKIAYIAAIKDFIAIVDKSTSMNEDDIIYVVNNISSILYEPDERSTHDEEYFSIEDHNSAIVLPKGTIRRLTGRDLKWEDDPISLKSKSVIDKFPHADIEFYKQKIINFVEWI